MSNFQSVAGGAVWVAVAAVMMLITFEPVSVEQKPAAAAAQLTAEAVAADAPAAA